MPSSAPATVDDIAWSEGEEPEQVQLAAPRKCRRHEWIGVPHPTRMVVDEDYGVPGAAVQIECARCHRIKDEAGSRRGRTNRSRGNSIERWVCKVLGITRVGMFGSPEDGGRHDEPWVVQVKSGGYFTERYWLELAKLTANANQTRLLVVTDAPGPGHRRRAYVVMDLDDFRALHVGSDAA